ncbi:hypothetical protein AGLY_004417 [Aphis glycines]|uniref:Uncharacterized protein n=1 Tax=Aphis glycines TaxID=307491 RepID=A0A6G0TY06_APHGL|nr:hypothetical protein AGLY_004417 [Aphis glycines]
MLNYGLNSTNIFSNNFLPSLLGSSHDFRTKKPNVWSIVNEIYYQTFHINHLQIQILLRFTKTSILEYSRLLLTKGVSGSPLQKLYSSINGLSDKIGLDSYYLQTHIQGGRVENKKNNMYIKYLIHSIVKNYYDRSNKTYSELAKFVQMSIISLDTFSSCVFNRLPMKSKRLIISSP